MVLSRKQTKRKLKENIPRNLEAAQQDLFQIAQEYSQGSDSAQEIAMDCYMLLETLEEIINAVKIVNTKV